MSAPGKSSEPALRFEVVNGSIGVITFDQPNSRANTLGQAVLAEFEKLLGQLAQRQDLQGLILKSGKPGMFIAGADLRELGSRPDPAVAKAITQRGLKIIAGFEALPYPTVAAIDGACMGGGLEIALGFDFRLATSHPKTELGFPEVKVGIFPGWGGTQRLTRVIGPSLAAEMICSGEPVKAERARQLGIVFDVVPGERLQEEALRLLAWAKESGAWREARKRKQQPVGLTEEQLTFTIAVTRAQIMEKTKGQFPAPLAALEAIAKGCNLPLEDGLKVESDLFAPLIGSPISRNLIAVFFMTQRLQKDPGVADASVQPRPVERVGVLGAGLMGAGIAGAHVRRGLPVMLLDSVPQALEKGLGNISKIMQARIEIGRMTPLEMVGALNLLSTTGTLAAMADRDVVIEAVIENEAAKTKLYRELQAILKPDVILASNTSTISITRMAKAWPKPENFAGMHFFNPVDRMQLVEVIRGEKTSDATTATLVALAKRIGKTPIVVRDCPGFLVNRILFPYINESLVLLEEGASPRAIDKGATAFGMPMGPITLNDLVGLDTSLYAGQVVNTAFADRAKTTRILDELVAAKRLGQKSGAGFYSYAKGLRGADDPALNAILEKVRTGRREIGLEEITDRLFLPMLVEASRVLSEGIVREPGDVDMGLILGIGFPPTRGGILRWADSLGLPRVLDMLKKYESLGPRFRPTEQMRRLAAEGKGFYKE
ncbi:MAG TPA: 3-hydroxyacyl-CoA dehydrogenase NAD-binding domain-containing protein [Gemmataceae bacterium]|jgi:3-hydroxyacyl-CoA dehydrogenase/enoyl-CoA hydratase/3-hydroxybutyryl-CoA epimerase/3-hydroxyacyl-CoA dehydrogenase/enoyl-CoA hydratase/3-hydroxybutyryl-CoA epimerase/enoyl-CoA isomerase|nr:3-hydroxyacyl-CoA dehydrogenase NAD-binding domain-containing protein [Gemmataceae bacterium]